MNSHAVAEGRRWHVYRLGEDRERVDQVEVSLGFEEGDRVEILPPEEGVEDLAHEHRHVRRVAAVRVGTGDIGGVRGGLGRRAECLSLEATSGGGGWW